MISDRIRTYVLQKKYSEILMSELDGLAVGYYFFFYNFSTWLGKPGIWLQDIFIVQQYRRQGLGLSLFKEVAKICQERDYARL